MDIPPEMAQVPGAEEGSVIELYPREGGMSCEVLPPLAPDVQTSVLQTCEEFKAAFAELKLARINRNRPAVSFGVTSGIDRFDVRAVVQFGDAEVALAEVGRALRKRERFIKLAAGSGGEIPPEWIEQYRHRLRAGPPPRGDGRLRAAMPHRSPARGGARDVFPVS